jgi:hypothetical protein
MSRSMVFSVLTFTVIDLMVEDLLKISCSLVNYFPLFLSSLLKGPSLSEVAGFVSVLWMTRSKMMMPRTKNEVMAAQV